MLVWNPQTLAAILIQSNVCECDGVRGQDISMPAWLGFGGPGATGQFPWISVSLLGSRIGEVRRLKKVRTPVLLDTL